MTVPLQSILLVEDNPADVELFRARLGASNIPPDFRLDTAHSLASGLQRVVQFDYDLVLLDLMLPDSEGVETFERMFQRQPTTPIIVFTGVADEHVGRQVISLGAQDYIQKDQVSIRGLGQQLAFAMRRREATAFIQERVQADSIYWIADTIAIEFNQILSDLMSNLNSIEGPLKDEPEALANARQASQHALAGADIMHLLLVLARPASNAHRTPVYALIEKTMESMRQQHGQQVDIVLSEHPCNWTTVFDDAQLRTLLLNIMAGAIGQVAAPIKVTIRSAEEHRDTANRTSGLNVRSRDCVSIQVTATGVRRHGEGPAPLNFAKQPGHELVKRFVEKCGGELYSRVHPVMGVTLELMLPRQISAKSSDIVQTYQQRLDVRSVNVLSIGLDSAAGRHMSEQISMLGYRVADSASLEEAVQSVAKGFRCDVVVMSDHVLESPDAMTGLSRILDYAFESKLLVVCKESALSDDIRHALPMPATVLVAPETLAEIDSGMRNAYYAELDA
ncbi:MAG: response regulator [Pseudomonadota bacterium]